MGDTENPMFSMQDVFSRGWTIFKENIGLLLGVHVIALCIEFLPQLLLGDSPGVKAVVVIFSLLLTFVTALGLVRIGLNLVDGEDANLADLFSCAHLVFKYLIASVLHGILILAGILLLIVPGLIWAAQFSQWPYLMVEHEMGPIEAMKESSRITRGTRGKLILLYFAMILLFILGVLAVLVGVVVAYAVATVIGATVYREILANQPNAEAAS
jgi:uncharacterized membrane protein